ncbi:MAG: hypothetical protein JXX14_05680 [Deltaproteobacteria bacterium]|nr:hypothetical protein [Deltaproteobacteria bacterium]
MGQALIILGVVFVAGAVLLLERRCLGKPAVVQPLVLCLLTGATIGEVEAGLWLGISLQLLSMGQSHYCNWVLAAISAAGGIAVMSVYDIHLAPGATATVAVLCASILVGIGFDLLDRKMNLSRSVSEQKGVDIWKSEQGGEEFTALIHRNIVRGFLFAGIQSVLGVGLVVTAGYLMLGVAAPAHPEVTIIVALVIPLFGVAVTLGSLSGRLFPLYALIGVAVSVGIGGMI